MSTKEIPKNKRCWVPECQAEIVEWPYCREHYENFYKKDKVGLKVPGLKGFDNTPTKHD